MVFLQLRRMNHEVYYYKTTNNLEVDFVVKEKDRIKELIQVSWDLYDVKTREREIKSLVTAMEELKLSKGLILTYDDEEEIDQGKKVIRVMPVWKWLLEK